MDPTNPSPSRLHQCSLNTHPLAGPLHTPLIFTLLSQHPQEKFEDKWQAHVLPKLREEVAVQHREEADTLRSLRDAAVASRGERLAAQSEAISSALARLGVRLREAQSLAALHCKPLTLPEKVRGSDLPPHARVDKEELQNERNCTFLV